MPRSFGRLLRDLEEIAGNAIVAGVLSAIGLIILSRLVNSGPARQFDQVPIAGDVLAGARAVVGQIVNP